MRIVGIVGIMHITRHMGIVLVVRGMDRMGVVLVVKQVEPVLALERLSAADNVARERFKDRAMSSPE